MEKCPTKSGNPTAKKVQEFLSEFAITQLELIKELHIFAHKYH